VVGFIANLVVWLAVLVGGCSRHYKTISSPVIWGGFVWKRT